MSLEGKAEKRSMYVDKRELEEGMCSMEEASVYHTCSYCIAPGLCVMFNFLDTIDKWDETKLKEVVQKKHGGKIKQRTDIVS